MKRLPLLPVLAAGLLAGCAGAASEAAPAPAAPEPAAVQTAEFPTEPPPLGPAPVLTPPDPVERSLPNGMRVLYVRQDEVPAVQAMLVTGGGDAADPADLPGLASFTASMLDEGAAGRSALEIAEALDRLGASLNVGSDWDGAFASLYVLRDNLPAALGLMADVVVRPDFPASELERLRAERITGLRRAADEPAQIAGNAFQALVYGTDHPYGRFATVEATERLDRARLADFHRGHYRPDRSTLILVGDVDPARDHALVERVWGGWTGRGAAAPEAEVPPTPTIPETKIYLVDKPGAAQSEIRIGHPGVARDTEDYFALQVLNTLLGGSFTSRLNNNLREVHGYTYGAGSGFAMRRGAGPFQARSAVMTAKTDSALIEFFNELRRIRQEPVPEDELQRAKNYFALAYPARLETSTDVAFQLADLIQHGLDASWLRRVVPEAMAVTPEEVTRVAREYVRPDRAVVVVVGDLATVEEAIRATGLAPVEVREVEEFVR